MKEIIATAEKEWPRIWKESQESSKAGRIVLEAWNNSVGAVVPNITAKDVMKGLRVMTSLQDVPELSVLRDWVIAIAGRFQYLLSEQDEKDILLILST